MYKYVHVYKLGTTLVQPVSIPKKAYKLKVDLDKSFYPYDIPNKKK